MGRCVNWVAPYEQKYWHTAIFGFILVELLEILLHVIITGSHYGSDPEITSDSININWGIIGTTTGIDTGSVFDNVLNIYTLSTHGIA